MTTNSKEQLSWSKNLNWRPQQMTKEPQTLLICSCLWSYIVCQNAFPSSPQFHWVFMIVSDKQFMKSGSQATVTDQNHSGWHHEITSAVEQKNWKIDAKGVHADMNVKPLSHETDLALFHPFWQSLTRLAISYERNILQQNSNHYIRIMQARSHCFVCTIWKQNYHSQKLW